MRTYSFWFLLVLLAISLPACAVAERTPTESVTQPSSVVTDPPPVTEPVTQPPSTQPLPSETQPPLTGWQEIDGKRYFYTGEGVPHIGWLALDGDHYYFLPDGTMAVGSVEIEGRNYYFASSGKYVLLVNRWNPVPEEYAPELVKVRGFRVDRSCAQALEQMLSDCEAAGYSVHINSGYRDVEKQQSIWDRRYQNYISQGHTAAEAERLVGESVAVPGTSEHHLGLAVDLDGKLGVLQWLADHCRNYGFVVRYPEGKTQYTGIISEPWHFRYVGRELAAELFQSGLCMEEYFASLSE